MPKALSPTMLLPQLGALALNVPHVWCVACVVRVSSPRMLAADTDGDRLRRAADAAAGERLGDAADNAANALDALEARAAARLQALGALDTPPPPPPTMQRSAFSKTADPAKLAEAEKAVERMRRRERGELEVEHAATIEGARAMARQWLTAGLTERAKRELAAVKDLVSYRTDIGAAFHLELASVAERNGESAEARRLRQRVGRDADSSSLRWQAEQALGKAAGTDSGASSGSANEELSSLFKLPSSWD